MDVEKFLAEATPSGESVKYSLRSVDSLEEEIRSALIKLLERGGKSSGHLRKALIEKEYAPELVDQLISRFIEVGLIDDFALAKDLANDMFSRKGKARGMISVALREKGLTKDAIDAALAEIDVDQELETAIALASSKLSRMKSLAPDVAQRRVAGFLSRRGYSSSVVWSAVRAAADSSSN